MIVHAAESLYWFNTTEPPYLIKRLPISLESRHTTDLNCTISCYYVQAVRPESRYKCQFGSNSLLFTAFKTV